MLKTRVLKNTYKNLNKNFTYNIAEDEALNRYMLQLIEEAEEDIRNGDCYTEEEFWRMQVESEIEKYGKPISDHIYQKYAKRS